MQEIAPKQKKKHLRCCVVDCKNNTINSPNLTFHKFPSGNIIFSHKVQRREIWLRAVRRTNDDGFPWVPQTRSRICSAHFIGNKKSDDPRSPSYNPTIFPSVYKKVKINAEAAINRYERLLKRRATIEVLQKQSKQLKSEKNTICQNPVIMENTIHDENCIVQSIETKDQSVQVDFLECNDQTQHIFICNRYISSVCEAETQAFRPPSTVKVTFISIKIKNNEKVDLPEEEKEAERNKKEEITVNEREKRAFHGFSSITREQELIDLAGTSFAAFNLLLKVQCKNEINIDNRKLISSENKLLIFLIKMKCGLTFSAISVLFGVHRSTVSRIFYSVLQYMSLDCKNFVQWPHKHIIQETMPSIFKLEYQNCRVIIDSTEFVVEQPPTISQRVQMYSHYKKGYRIKTVIGCSPCGLICFVSKCHGGRATDSQITVTSGLLNLLEPGDLVLADKGFPQIKTLLDESGRNILLVMPPFLHNEHFTEEEVEDTFKVARVRIHIERIMQRIRTYKIVDKFSIEMLPNCDNIIFMCCVLVNLQAPIIREED